jgi:hypothetical protein
MLYEGAGAMKFVSVLLLGSVQQISIAKESYPDTLTDEDELENVTVGVPGVGTVRVPYRKTRVIGYTVTRASAPESDTFFDYVRNGVAKQCRDLIDSGQFVVVEQEARATKTAHVIRGPIADTIHVGSVSVGGVDKEVVLDGPPGVTFGIIGQQKATP